MSRDGQAHFTGIGSEAKNLLASRNVSSKALSILARMNPVRQAEVARLMVAADCYSAPYAKALIGGTDRSLINGPRARAKVPMQAQKRKAASQEITALADQLNKLSDLDGSDLITVLVACKYVERLLANQRIRKYLGKKCPKICKDLEDLIQVHRDVCTCPRAVAAMVRSSQQRRSDERSPCSGNSPD
jgi:hypothetical protein